MKRYKIFSERHLTLTNAYQMWECSCPRGEAWGRKPPCVCERRYVLERMIYNKITLSGTRTQVHAPATNGDQVAPRQRAVAAHGGATPMAGQMQAEVRGTPVAFKPCESLSMDGLGYRCNRPRPGLPSAGGLRWALAGLAGLPGPPPSWRAAGGQGRGAQQGAAVAVAAPPFLQ